MYESYLSFYSLPKPGVKVCGFAYRYVYMENVMCSIDAQHHEDAKKLVILNIEKGYSPTYESMGFSHLGTRLFTDMLIDMEWRLGLKVRQISGWLSNADKRKGNWAVSLPFYAGLPSRIYPRYHKAMDFSILDSEKSVLLRQAPGEDIRGLLSDIIANHDELYFEFRIV